MVNTPVAVVDVSSLALTPLDIGLRMLLAILPVEEGEPEEQRLVRSVVALARITQHSDLGGALRVLRGGAGMDEMTQVAYLLR